MDSEERLRQERGWLTRSMPIVEFAWDVYTSTGEWPTVEVVQRRMDQSDIDLDVQLSLQDLPQLPGELRSVTWSVADIPLRVLRHWAALN